MSQRISSVAQSVSRNLALVVPILLALVVRIALWGNLPRTGLISDEGEYLSAAHWLAAGRSFDWYQGYFWTRAPLYPLFVAAHLRLFGDTLLPLYITQTILSLLIVVFVYWLAKRLMPAQPGYALLAACTTALYLPFTLYTQVVLSETLFITLILAGFLALARAQLQVRSALLAGILFGLATLTRSLTLGFLPIVIIWLLRNATPIKNQPRWVGYRSIAAFLLALSLTILPWTIYNSRMYGGLVLIDTSGAYNLLLGARTAYDGKRSDAQVRDFALGLLGQPTASPITNTCVPFPGTLASQAARQAATTREGLCLIAARPLAFVEKSLAELIDLFQINYTGAERFTNGFSTGRLDPSYLIALFLLDDTLYVVVLPLAVIGWAIARASSRSSNNLPLVSLIGLWWIYNIFIAPLLFAINRFRLPLMPFACIFAAFALMKIAHAWRKPQSSPAIPGIVQKSANHLPLTTYHLRKTNRPFLALAALLATLLFLIAATPYAYLEPLTPGQDSRLASYLGPYPSSFSITRIALGARQKYLHDQQFAAAIQQDDLGTARMLLQNGNLGLDTTRLGPAILAAREANPQTALALLPSTEVIAGSRDTLAAVLRGDLLRTSGDQPAALNAFSARFVDDQNPVAWAWQWLQPAPTTRINIGGSLDLGYIHGCYLGEGDTTISPPANFRWCTDGAQLRFPAAANGNPQTLVLRADGRAWQSYGITPRIRVSMAGRDIAFFQLDPTIVQEYYLDLPAMPTGSDILITLHSPTFVPDAARYNSQQGEAVVGQVQYLAIRLDWADLR